MNNISREHRVKAQILKANDTPVRVTLDEFQKFHDVEVPLRAELDRRTITVRELLALTVGDLLPLSRPIGENIDLIAGDTVLGNAEILAIDDKLAVRVADIGDKQLSSNSRPNQAGGVASSSELPGVPRDGLR